MASRQHSDDARTDLPPALRSPICLGYFDRFGTSSAESPEQVGMLRRYVFAEIGSLRGGDNGGGTTNRLRPVVLAAKRGRRAKLTRIVGLRLNYEKCRIAITICLRRLLLRGHICTLIVTLGHPLSNLESLDLTKPLAIG
jgi:hypothetical protein